MNLILNCLQFIVFLVMILLSVAFFSLLERKILGMIHFRKGPNKVFINGLFQPFSDAMKLISKDDFPLSWSNKITYYLSPILMMILSCVCWLIIPSFWGGTNNKFSFILLFFILSMSIYGIMMSGWSSNSKYAMIGAIRGVSQSISYEVTFSFCILSLVIYYNSYSMNSIFSFFPSFLALIILSFIFFFSLLAELNRTPFDLAEGESELVSGYSVEYGGIMYTLIFLSENMFTLFACFIFSFFFMSHSNLVIFTLINLFLMFMFCLLRGVLPRMRYDKLMSLCWKKILPISMIVCNIYFIFQFF